jgi:hypothetical protein
MAEKSNRSTIEYTLKSKNHIIIFNEYLTGREKRIIKNAIWTGKSMQIKDGKGESDAVPMEQLDLPTDKTIELMVMSIDGSDKDILQRILDLRDRDYDDVLEKIEELTGPIATEKKDDGPENTKS